MARESHRNQLQRWESLASVTGEIDLDLVVESPLLILLNLSQCLGGLLFRLGGLSISTSLGITDLLVLDRVALSRLLQIFDPLLSAGKLILKVLDGTLKIPLLSLEGDVGLGKLLVLVGLDCDLSTELGDGSLESDDDLLEVADCGSLLGDLSILLCDLSLKLGALLLGGLEIGTSLLKDLKSLGILELVVRDDLVESGNLLLVTFTVLQGLIESLLELLGLGNGGIAVSGEFTLGLVDVLDLNLESLDLLKGEVVIGVEGSEALRNVSMCRIVDERIERTS